MKNITYVTAIENAISALSILDSTECDRDATIARLEALRDSLTKRNTVSEEAKAKRSEKQKAATAAARVELVNKVAPILRNYLNEDITAKALFEAAKAELPADFSAAKVQNILLRELKDELIKTETKGKANTYRLAK